MKVIFLILGLYLLYLPCIPCADGISLQSADAVHLTISNDGGSHKEVDNECSPCCVCSCCSTTTISQPLAQLDPPNLNYLPHTYIEYISTSIKGISMPVWQPPKFIS